MKKLLGFIILIILAAGCSKDGIENPVNQQPNNSEKDNVLSKKESEAKISHEKILPELLKYMETKRGEYGIKTGPNFKPQQSKTVDITKIPDYVPLTLNDIEKLSTGNGKYFSGQNTTQRDDFTLHYYSWSVPYPNVQKPFFEYMGSAQSSETTVIDYMYVESDHYLNEELQDYPWNEDYDVTSLTAEDWHEQAEIPYLWEVSGWHYFYNYPELPWLDFLDNSYAYDEVGD